MSLSFMYKYVVVFSSPVTRNRWATIDVYSYIRDAGKLDFKVLLLAQFLKKYQYYSNQTWNIVEL